MSIKLPVFSALIVLLAATLLIGSTSPVSATHMSGKRFDCRLFCKMTGYHGTIGGCRCSFTLFTAKRSQPNWSSRSVAELEPDGAMNGSPFVPATSSSHYRVTLPYALNKRSAVNEGGEWNTMPHSEETSFSDASIFK